MTRNWNELEEVSLAGRYCLKQCLSSTADDAWYLTRSDGAHDAAVRVLPADAPSADEQLAMWREATAFDHPHLVRMLDAGRAELDGADVIYAVCEYPDDFLAAAVEKSPLSAAEALEVLGALLSALAFLHDRGLAHGAVDPEHVMAFGDTVKLTSDTIRRGDGAADILSLGATLQEIVTQPAAEPFASIIRHSLTQESSERWTVHDIENWLAPAPARPKQEAPPIPARRLDRGFPLKWVPVAGLVAALALGAVFLRHVDSPPAPPVIGTAPEPVAPVLPPRAVESAAAHPNPAAIWRVVVYTYSSRAAAEKKAHSLNEKHPAWRAEVFAPKRNRAPYYVSLGGRMTLPQAERLQKEARAMGLPRDTFVRNFTS